MSLSTFKRFELKFLLNKSQLDGLLKILPLYMNPDEFCKNGETYNIYNIYYDTFDSSLIRTSLSKPCYKEKLRLRSYSIPSSPDSKVYLELKKKTAGIVHKRRASMTLQDAYVYLGTGKHPVTRNYINGQVINELDYFLSHHQISPATFISYTRRAFFGKNNKNFRLTLDSNITTRRYDLALDKGNYGEQLLGAGQYLMEVKIPDSVPMWLAAELSRLNIYKTSFSKYGEEYKNFCLNNPQLSYAM